MLMACSRLRKFPIERQQQRVATTFTLGPHELVRVVVQVAIEVVASEHHRVRLGVAETIGDELIEHRGDNIARLLECESAKIDGACRRASHSSFTSSAARAIAALTSMAARRASRGRSAAATVAATYCLVATAICDVWVHSL
jgi:hypothetical protein